MTIKSSSGGGGGIAGAAFISKGLRQNIKSNDEDKVEEYTNLLNQLRQDLTAALPSIDKNLQDLFLATCESVLAAKAARDAADKARNEATDDKQKADANAAVDAADAAFEKTVAVNIAAARPILDGLHLIDQDGTMDIDMTSLAQCFVLAHGTPQALGEFANRGSEQAALIDGLLNNASLMQQIVLAAGARGGKYGEAMQVYDAICKQTKEVINHDILQRFALATALEHAEPYAEFDTPTIFVDPVKRYLHYERAYLCGELDPTFADRTTWECRMICNSDAPDEQLGWGRDMLRNYRPDEILDPDYVWRYCRSVRTEVGYRTPEWTDAPRTYQQLISGGGKCGPRAWFGRFICKAYGIPTWGARQPGHAMMHHWTPQGWVPVLGANWKFSWWEGRCGLDFLLETQARTVGEDKYSGAVRCLEMIGGAVLCEPALDSMTVYPNPCSLWCSLALMAKHILAKSSRAAGSIKSVAVERNVQNVVSKQLQDGEENTAVGDNRIVIPAANCSEPRQSTNNIIFSKSFLGGRQLHHTGGDAFEYTLTDITDDQAGTYNIVIRVCTVHLKQQPLILSISCKSSEASDDIVGITTIVVPYTVGEWQYTDPVEVQLSSGSNVLSFSRETPNFGLTIKDITLTKA